MRDFTTQAATLQIGDGMGVFFELFLIKRVGLNEHLANVFRANFLVALRSDLLWGKWFVLWHGHAGAARQILDGLDES